MFLNFLLKKNLNFEIWLKMIITPILIADNLDSILIADSLDSIHGFWKKQGKNGRSNTLLKKRGKNS